MACNVTLTGIALDCGTNLSGVKAIYLANDASVGDPTPDEGMIKTIDASGCKFRILKLKNPGKNALDFYIAIECGMLVSGGEKQLAIVSNDKGFQAVLGLF